jgi:hypothetical protein
MSGTESPTPAEQPNDDARGAAPRASHHRVRRVSAWILVVLASLLIPLSVVTVWAVRTVENTDHYVETLSPLARNPVVTDYVAVRATDALFSELKVQNRIESALPKKASFLAAPISTEMKGFVQTQVTKVLQSPWFPKLWDTLNRQTHTLLVDLLTGKPNPKLAKAQDVALNLSPVLTKAITELDQRGITVFNPLEKKLGHGEHLKFVVATQAQVKQFHSYFKAAYDAAWWLPLSSLALVVLAAIVAVDRRKTLLRIAVGAALFDVVLLAGLAIARTHVIQHTAGLVSPAVTGTVFDTMLRYLRHGLRFELLVVLLIAVALWLAGPSRWARWIRRTVAAGVLWVVHQGRARTAAGSGESTSSGARSAAGWMLAHVAGMRNGGAMVAGLIIVFGGNLSPGGVFWTAVALVIYLGLLQLVLVWARRVTAPGPAGDVPASTGSPAAGRTDSPVG